MVSPIEPTGYSFQSLLDCPGLLNTTLSTALSWRIPDFVLFGTQQHGMSREFFLFMLHFTAVLCVGFGLGLAVRLFAVFHFPTFSRRVSLASLLLYLSLRFVLLSRGTGICIWMDGRKQ